MNKNEIKALLSALEIIHDIIESSSKYPPGSFAGVTAEQTNPVEYSVLYYSTETGKPFINQVPDKWKRLTENEMEKVLQKFDKVLPVPAFYISDQNANPYAFNIPSIKVMHANKDI